jgi:hypothetical protein
MCHEHRLSCVSSGPVSLDALIVKFIVYYQNIKLNLLLSDRASPLRRQARGEKFGFKYFLLKQNVKYV